MHAAAGDDNNRTISSLGSQGTGYVQFTGSLSQPCLFGLVYLPDLSQPGARGMFAILLAAQARGATVSASYTMDASGACTATKISSP
jgi:hypothetical protein